MVRPQNFAELVIWYYIIGILVLYFLGAQFLTGPGLGWLFFLYILKRLWQQTDETPEEEKIRIPIALWIWAIGLLILGFALIIGHFDVGYDLPKTIRSFINFFLRTWALFFLFPLVGCLKIRPQIIYRAVCILCLQCLIVTLICYLAHFTGLELPRYTSSLLAKIGGNDPRYYRVSFFLLEGGTKFRLLMFAPWPPALAFAGNIFFCLASQERDRRWRWIGMISSALMIWGSASRLGILCLIVLPFLKLALVNLSRPTMQIAMGVGSLVSGLFGYQIIEGLLAFKEFFENQRASSTQVRETLARMGIYQWRTEAPIWGHAVLKPQGPQVIQFMPIGSHHTWIGLLYTHGIVGFLAILIPVVYSFGELLIKAQTSKIAQTSLMILIIILLFSMGENIDTLAYLFWPGLVLLGMAFNEPLFKHETARLATEN